MGIYDRDYLKSEPKGFTLGGDRMMVTNLMLLNGAVFVAQLLVPDLTDKLALSRDLFSAQALSHPWWILNLVTYGFTHAPNNLLHIAFNMFGLWFFGRDIEWKYGRGEFLSLYLTTIVFAGLVWVGVGRLAGEGGTIIGASGGVTGVMVLYVLSFPKRVLYVWGVLPLPAWALGALWLLSDLSSALQRDPGDNVAYVAHLAGGAYGLIYFQTGWSPLRLLPRNFSLKSLKPKPRLRVHDPDEYEEEVGQQVDDILRKIQEQGQDSLTAKERRILEQASRRYQQKHR